MTKPILVKTFSKLVVIFLSARDVEMALKRPTTVQITRSCFENDLHFFKQETSKVIQIVMIAVALMSVGLILTGALLTYWLVNFGHVK